MMKQIILACVAALSVAVPAQAQYYAPGYYAPPPRYYPSPGSFGARCDTIIRTPYGPEHMICPIVEPKPLGYGCACPAPRRAGYRGGYIPGRTIR